MLHGSQTINKYQLVYPLHVPIITSPNSRNAWWLVGEDDNRDYQLWLYATEARRYRGRLWKTVSRRTGSRFRLLNEDVFLRLEALAEMYTLGNGAPLYLHGVSDDDYHKAMMMVDGGWSPDAWTSAKSIYQSV
jgi:hypothetical protein